MAFERRFVYTSLMRAAGVVLRLAFIAVVGLAGIAAIHRARRWARRTSTQHRTSPMHT